MLFGSCLALLALPSLAVVQVNSPAPMTPINLRCENQIDPLALDTLNPRFSWQFKDDPKQHSQGAFAYRILVSSTPEILAKNIGDLWDSGMVSSSDQNNIKYAGSKLHLNQTCYWKVAVWTERAKQSWERPTYSKPAKFETGTSWTSTWIDDGKPIPTNDEDFYKNDPAPLFRKEFAVKSGIAKARLYITGLGYYEASINGTRIGDHVLDPGWTNFDKRTLYSTYDVTKNLKQGQNCLGAIVGNGWYNPLPLKLFGSFNLRKELPTGRPCLIARLEITYQDGTTQSIRTDETWKVGESHILQNSIYLGEVVDARKEQIGWNKPGFNDSSWSSASASPKKAAPIEAQSLPPIRVTKTWTAATVTNPKPGIYIYDMGVNFAGWASFKLDLPAGTELHMRYGELLYKDGTLNPMTSVAGQIKSAGVGGPGAPKIAWQTDTYITRGGGETYTPKFTFHGFRYVEVTGLDKPLPLKNVTAHRLNSDVEQVGTFECSNPMLNQIQEMCQRTFLSNIFSVQSDCPHRERLGYGGDIVATSEALMMNYDMSGFYRKVVRDYADAARPDGMFTDTAPFIGIQYCGVIWAMAHPLLVEQLYQYYGDTEIGLEQYEAAKKWLLAVDAKYPDGIVKEGLSDHESLTPSPSPEMVTPLYFKSALLLKRIANRNHRKADEAQFTSLAEKVKAAYNQRFVDKISGKVGPGTQASQSTALYTRIIDDAVRPAALKYLLSDIQKNKGHLTTGILGTKFMLHVLSDEDHADVAYKIATQPDFPGWGWMMKNGATTLWEHWEFSDNTFSHNHPMFGSVSQWMFNWLGGIRISGIKGAPNLYLTPKTPEGLKWVKSSYLGPTGRIVSNWRKEAGQIVFEFVIPPSTDTIVYLPVDKSANIKQRGSNRKFSESIFSLGSGHYTFVVKTAADK